MKPESPVYITDRKILADKKSQSALEYMMTYGWAILIIVIVAAVLYSLGIFNPSASIFASVNGFGGLGSVTASCISNYGLVLKLGDALGVPLNISTVIVTTSNGTRLVADVPTAGIIVNAGSMVPVFISNACPSTGVHYSLDIIVNYSEIGVAFAGPYSSSGVASGTGVNRPVQVLANISVGTHPHTVTYYPVNGNLYIVNNGIGTISVISSFTNAVVNTIKVYNASPISAVYVPTDRDFYVTYSAGANISVITPSGSLVTTIKTGEETWGAVLDSQNKLLYVGSRNSSKVFIINTSTNAIVAEPALPAALTSGTWSTAAYDPANGDIYVPIGNKLVTTVISGVTPTENITGAGWNDGVYDPKNGYVYFATWAFNSTAVIDPLTSSTIANISLGPCCASNVAYDPSDGNIYTSEWGTNSIFVISNSNVIINNISMPFPNADPLRLTYDPINGLLYAGLYNQSKVIVLGLP